MAKFGIAKLGEDWFMYIKQLDSSNIRHFDRYHESGRKFGLNGFY